tara:strand:- start:5415 stop:6524 length:1110 start_codon:yes stop_codon:yes gene_type:complete
MAKTKVAFKQIKLNSSEFRGATDGNIELLEGGVAYDKLAVLSAVNKVIGSSAASQNPDAISLTNAHFSAGAYSAITGVGVQSQSMNMNNFAIQGLAEPTQDADGATKAYVLQNGQYGIQWKSSARAATAAAADLSGFTYNAGKFTESSATGALSLDGVVLANDDRILVKDQATGAQNGIYVVSNIGGGLAVELDRASDLDTGANANGCAIMVREGTLAADKGYLASSDTPPIVGTDDPAFILFTGVGNLTAGSGLNVPSQNELEILDDGIIASKLKARRITGTIASGGTPQSLSTAYDAGMVDAELAMVFLNGVLLRAASNAGDIGVGGDYFIASAGVDGDDSEIEVNADLIASGGNVDKFEIRYIMAA